MKPFLRLGPRAPRVSRLLRGASVAAALCSLALTSAPARAEETRTVDHARLRAGDVIEGAPEAVASVDLGPAPPPGGSRLIGHGEVEDRLRAAGINPLLLTIPNAVRIVSASQKWNREEIARRARPIVERALPRGVSLTQLEANAEFSVPPNAVVAGAKLAKLPRQGGPFRTTVTLEVQSDGVTVTRIPVSLVLDIGADAAHADVSRGGKISLIIEHRGVRISAYGIALSDANVGEELRASVQSTGRVVRAKLVGTEVAEVLDAQ